MHGLPRGLVDDYAYLVKRTAPLFAFMLVCHNTPVMGRALLISDTITTDPIHLSLAALVAAIWLAIAVWAIIRASRLRGRARLAEAWGLRLRGLLSTAPHGYLIVSSDGAITCSDTLRTWLSLDRKVVRLEELSANGLRGLRDEDFRLLVSDIQALAMTGASFSRLVSTERGDRVLLAVGQPAPIELAGDMGTVIWFADATSYEQSMAQILKERDTLNDDLNATTALLEAAPFPVWRRDGGLKLRHVNSAYVRAVEAHGATEAVVRGLELVNNALSTAPEKAAQRARDLGVVQTREEHVIIDSKRRTLQIFDVPLGEAGVGGFALDVTEREDARSELARYGQAQNETLDRLSAAVVIFSNDASLIFYNKAFVNLFALEPSWLEERPEMGEVLERLRDIRRVPEQRDFPAWKKQRLAWFTDVLDAVEEIWVLPDETVLRVLAQPHPLGGLLIVFEDRTEQLTLESSRDTLLKVQEATLNNLYEAVAVFGSSGRLQLHNRRYAELWNVSAEFLDSEPHVDAVADMHSGEFEDTDQAHELVDSVRQATLGRRSSSGRLRLSKDRIVDFGAVPLPDGAALVTFIDVTASTNIEEALRERNEALEAADQLKSQFVTNISYELRTPLTSIIGFSEMLDQEFFGTLTSKQREYVRSILTSSERLLVLINDILDLAVTDAGVLALEIGALKIEPIIQSVINMVSDQAHACSLNLNWKIHKTIGMIEGDERRLKQALYNLLSNAIRFTPPGGNITVTATGTKDYVQVEVADTGVGIMEEEQELVFEQFRKGSNVGAGARQGLGLGLSLVRHFVALHGGTVELSSKLNEGTTVTVHLPRKVRQVEVVQ